MRGFVLHIQLSEIPEEGIEFLVNDVGWFPDKEIRRDGELKARVFIERRQERLMARGSIDLVRVFECDRCLETYSMPQTVEFSLALERNEEVKAPVSKEHQCDSNEMDVVLFEGNVLDIGAILEQQVLLATPVKTVCREDCLGLCSTCGKNLNHDICSCSDKQAESPFSVLGRLIKK